MLFALDLAMKKVFSLITAQKMLNGKGHLCVKGPS